MNVNELKTIVDKAIEQGLGDFQTIIRKGQLITFKKWDVLEEQPKQQETKPNKVFEVPKKESKYVEFHNKLKENKVPLWAIKPLRKESIKCCQDVTALLSTTGMTQEKACEVIGIGYSTFVRYQTQNKHKQKIDKLYKEVYGKKYYKVA